GGAGGGRAWGSPPRRPAAPTPPPREVNPDIPDWLDAIVRKLLAKNPADRFQTATEVAELLGQHLAHLQQPMAVPMPAAAIIPGSGERVWRQIFEAVDHDRRLWEHRLMPGGLLLPAPHAPTPPPPRR